MLFRKWVNKLHFIIIPLDIRPASSYRPWHLKSSGRHKFVPEPCDTAASACPVWYTNTCYHCPVLSCSSYMRPGTCSCCCCDNSFEDSFNADAGEFLIELIIQVPRCMESYMLHSFSFFLFSHRGSLLTCSEREFILNCVVW